MEKLRSDIGLRQRLEKRLYPLVLLVWLLIGIGFPAMVYSLQILAAKNTATTYAQDIAEKLSALVQVKSDWQKYLSQNQQLIVQQLPSQAIAVRILNAQGQAIAIYKGATNKQGILGKLFQPSAVAPIKVNNRELATVEVTLISNNIEKFTWIFLLLFASLGTGLASLIYFVPTKLVSNMEWQLQNLIATLQAAKAQSESLQVKAQASEQRFRDLVQGLDAIVWEADAIAMQFSFISQRAEELLGYRVEDWLEKIDFPKHYIHPEDYPAVSSSYQRAIVMGEDEAVEYRAIATNGREVWLRDIIQVVKNSAGVTTLLRGVIVDITQFKIVEQKLVHDALHDVLTGLANRALLMQQLAVAVERAKQHPDYTFAVLFLDLDRFKAVNDSLGHRIGDQLLIAISRRLEKCVRSSDTIARLGGDEFAIFLDDIKDIDYVINIAERIQQELEAPFNLSGHEIFAATSIGIALSSGGSDRPENLLRDADTAMYYAKSQGKARYEMFNHAMHDRAMATLQLEIDLRRAIERQEFEIYYQPIVTLKSADIIGFEALLRWQHPRLGFVAPADFIPIAEETGLIVPLGQWAIAAACKQLRLWQSKFPKAETLSISVNFSSKQFAQPNFVQQIEQILQATDLKPCHLNLEITESVMMQSTQPMTDMLACLKTLGVKLYLDDFGTGYSSLSYLHRFPIDVLKIDRSFVIGMGEGDEENSKIEIVQTILALAANMGIEVIAEGIETTAQLTKLKQLKCKYGQGYFFCKPLSSEACEELLALQLQW